MEFVNGVGEFLSVDGPLPLMDYQSRGVANWAQPPLDDLKKTAHAAAAQELGELLVTHRASTSSARVGGPRYIARGVVRLDQIRGSSGLGAPVTYLKPERTRRVEPAPDEIQFTPTGAPTLERRTLADMRAANKARNQRVAASLNQRADEEARKANYEDDKFIASLIDPAYVAKAHARKAHKAERSKQNLEARLAERADRVGIRAKIGSMALRGAISFQGRRAAYNRNRSEFYKFASVHFPNILIDDVYPQARTAFKEMEKQQAQWSSK